MNLINLIGGTVTPYLEYAWICAPNTAGQLLTGESINTCTLTTELFDTGNFGSLSTNQVTLSAGTYIYSTHIPIYADGWTYAATCGGLYNVTSSSWVSAKSGSMGLGSGKSRTQGQFTIGAPAVFEIRISLGTLPSGNFYISNGYAGHTSTLATAGADQRTTLKLWKLN